ncbi:flagellar motor switch protein FliN/FliY [Dyella sp. SG562]|jgi:flagellar motor switch protein FliN/FliY|uniref:FliM/FliN family flagellar motor C-terminal domain-containing protein n=1 Tax=Dyella sp. SG562 TaxID=2587017 RepID=UPI00142057E5|nr:FliM/FliN family flagellar motor C-terminal domain-containing protein [Dyella sp. SG562]NII74898.1 flagellar motor switch protein FliN/FliY [Dyella sp. SG562]
MNSVLVEPLALPPLADAEADEGASARAAAPDLSLVGHVKVRLTAVLGETEVSLAELFELKAGKVLTLGQGLEEPVTLQLNGKPVATAQLMAVGDHFGVQIVQVL